MCAGAPFTLEQGDEAAAQLASRFAEVANEVVASREGEVVELRGDVALAVFPERTATCPLG
jgi:class 3 adenylate cyclase